MKFVFEVQRVRQSVTQGTATVYLNGEKVLTFGDEISHIEDGQTHYGEVIGNWASIIPDSDFIKGVLFHPFDNIYHYSDRVKEILSRQGATK